ncbi:glycerophosphodiester phosphodiesterase [Thermogemmatispora carboxidivorans]|uniref:glycerophosphodiester phosphodiesterase n=1 Tax=Thermogemmatispora carboxidivorans TaxID=1382306 RepID=UPI00069B8984|nr:glycerophosphodiester phosphodiesterase family protein [Thermogemmatispora carboxidivorans]
MVSAVQRVAHRGGAQLAPENTLAAFRQALALPVDAIELDVQMSRDGRLIVFHDATVERLTDGRGNILDLDFAYLRSLNAAAHFPGGWPEPQRIPTLREVLDLVRGQRRVWIEIKPSRRGSVYGRYPGIAEAVVDELQRADMLDQAVVISFDWYLLPEVKRRDPRLETGAILSEDIWDPQAGQALDTLVEQVRELGCSWLDVEEALFLPHLPALVHSYGLKLGIWTVNTAERLRELAASGVDALTSDQPTLFTALS